MIYLKKKKKMEPPIAQKVNTPEPKKLISKSDKPHSS